MRGLPGILICVLMIFSCASVNQKTSADYVIRYINMNSVYEYVYNNSSEAQSIKRNSEILNLKIDEIETSSQTGTKSELLSYQAELARVKEQEKKLKSELYARIKTAVKNTAAKHNADFILNSGDGVVYSRPVYDLTNEVIKELKALEVRSSPAAK